MSTIRSICVYCGSQPGNNPRFVEAAKQIGKTLANANVTLVFGGGVNGIMGACSQSASEHGGEVIGIIPEFLQQREANNEAGKYCSELIVTASMHERKQLMFDKVDAFLALPGGIGTLEEVVEILTWAQIGRHEKPIGLLNIDGFWNPLMELFDHMREHGFIHSANKFKPIVITEPERVLDMLA